jgi:alanyl-tRNA synthetase
VVTAVKTLIEEKSLLQKKVDSLENEKLQNVKFELLKRVEDLVGVQIIAEKVNVPNADSLKQLAYDLKTKMTNAFIVLGAEINEKPLLAVMIDEALMKDKNLHAGNIVKEAAKEMRGGGGGQPHFATAGGSDVNGLLKAIAKAKSFIQ